MTQQLINVGLNPNDGTGDPLRTAFTKVNANFTEVYGRFTNVKDFGAVGDWVSGVGGTDNGPAFSAAVASAVQTGKRVYIPAGKYLIGSAVTVAEGVWFQGEGWEEEPNPGDGTWLIVSNTSFTPFAFSGIATRGARFDGIAFFQTQPSLSVGWTPNPYPPFISINSALGSLDIVDCFAVSITKFVSSVNSGRLYMRRVKGQVYNYLAEVDQCFDVPMFDDIHVWPFNSSDNNILQYQQANCDAFRFMRVDSPMLGKIFIFGARSAIHMFDSASGHTTKLTCDALTADFVNHPVWVESSSATGSFGIIEGQQEAWPSTGAAIVGSSTFRIDGNDCHFNIWSLRSDRAGTSAIELVGGGNQVQVGSLRVGQGSVVVPQALYLASVGAGNANVIQLALPPFLEGVTALSNSATNGVVGYGAFSQGLGQVGLNFSYDSGANRMLFQPAGSPNVSTQIYADGTGSVNLGVSGTTVLRVDRPASGDTGVLVRNTTGNVAMITESGSANADLLLTPKGSTGSVRLQANGGTVVRVDRPASGDSDVLVRSNTGNVAMIVESGSTNANLIIAAKGTGVVGASTIGGLGYLTGAGGAVAQATSRTTAVTLNTPTGAITLFNAAGSASYQTFTVNDSAVAATDVIQVSQKSGTDKYILLVSAVRAGSFDITFATTGGTTTEQPVINFAVMKAVTS